MSSPANTSACASRSTTTPIKAKRTCSKTLNSSVVFLRVTPCPLWLVLNSDRAATQVRHAHQRPLRKGHIQQRRRRTERRPKADDFDDQERRNRPEQVQNQNSEKDFLELHSQLRMVKTNRRE